MSWIAWLYIAFMLISLPFGMIILRRLKNDILHPFGGLLSTLISGAFVLGAFFPEMVPFRRGTAWGLFAFALGWDLYTLNELRHKLPTVLAITEEDAKALDKGSLLVGIMLMLPAYLCGLYVCLRTLEM